MERIPFPDKLVGWFDIVKGLGETALHFLGDQLKHETPSEHFTERYDVFDLDKDVKEGWTHGNPTDLV